MYSFAPFILMGNMLRQPFNRVSRIVSGGQTGADRAALDWAIANGVPHGGWCPKGRKAEDGPLPERYLLSETNSAGYLSRVENGQANPTINAVEVIANALGMTVFDLFDKVKGQGVASPVKRAASGAGRKRAREKTDKKRK